MKTKKELQAEKVLLLNTIDDILKTAKEANRSLTAEEIVAHDAAVAAVDAADEDIVRAGLDEDTATRQAAADARRTAYAVPNVNVRGSDSVGAGVTRNLDALLYATAETVAASNGLTHNKVEQLAVRSQGADIVAPRISEFWPADREAIRNFQDTVAEMSIVGLLVDKRANSSSEGFQVARALPQFKDRWNHVLRAMDVDTAAEGTEWVPTGIGASLHEKVRAEGKVAPLFQTINLPTNPWKWPIEGADATAYRVAEPTADNETKMTASTPGTVVATFDAEIFGARTLWSKSLDADSAVAIAGYQQRKLVQAFAAAREKAILDGDTDGSHMDSDVGASTTDARTAWDGLRKKGIAQTVVTATTASVANLLAIRKGMGKWGVNPSDLVYIVGVSSLHALLADTNLLTVDKMGPQATILNGMIGSVGGVPVVVSEHMRENLNASGVYDGITTTKTYILCVNRNEWALGVRQGLDVEVNDSLYGETFQRVAYAFSREDFMSIASAATNEDTAIAYNVTP